MKAKVFNINKNKKLFTESALAARKGKICVFPTDTVYGIGTNALNKKSVSKIYKLKKRKKNKPLPLLVSSVHQAQKYVRWNKSARKLAKKFLPGNLTLILKPKGTGLKIAYAGKGLAVRIPKHKKLLCWIRKINAPLASTSANMSGKPALMSEKEVIKKFGAKADYILTGGRLKSEESTVVDLTGKTLKILRERKITKSDIEKIL